MNNYIDKLKSLTPFVKSIGCEKATEPPRYHGVLSKKGSFLCKRCGLALFRGSNEFSSHCGWPSFDETIVDAVKEIPDIDGVRTEIICHRCESHLGHVFVGEYYTAKNKRYCLNLAMLDWVGSETVVDTEEAIVAGGCFWGVEYYLNSLSGVLSTEVGYIGGHLFNPTYEQICQGNTGHFEAVRVIFDKDRIDYTSIIRRFFELHDFTQANGQGPDIGYQYKSAIFCYNEQQKNIAEDLINQLKQKNYDVKTQLLSMQIFWPAETYHQAYYLKNNKHPYCHRLNHVFE